MTKISEYLKKGYENRISTMDLMTIFGLDSVRELRRCINAERLQGAAILSTKNGGGYYLPENEDEKNEFVAMMRAEARTLVKVAEAVENGAPAV